MAETVLVTGACGFIGPYIVEELLRKGYEVRATDLPEADDSPVRGLGCEIQRADLASEDQAAEIMKGVDRVINSVARMVFYLDRRSYEIANYQTTVNILKSAAGGGVTRFVHISTVDTYGPPKTPPADENHPQNPVSLYAKTKLYAEQAAFRCHRDTGLPLSVLRPAIVYGPRCAYALGFFLGIPVLIKELGVKRMPLPKAGFEGHFVHAVDVAASAVHLMELPEAVGQAYNIADDSPGSFGELAEIVFDSIGVSSNRILPLPLPVVKAAARLAYHFPDAVYAKLNEILLNLWDRVAFKHNLVPGFRPRFDPGFTSFGRGDYRFDNSKIKATGYELRYPDFSIGWSETVSWFMENEWIPRY